MPGTLKCFTCTNSLSTQQPSQLGTVITLIFTERETEAYKTIYLSNLSLEPTLLTNVPHCLSHRAACKQMHYRAKLHRVEAIEPLIVTLRLTR